MANGAQFITYVIAFFFKDHGYQVQIIHDACMASKLVIDNNFCCGCQPGLVVRIVHCSWSVLLWECCVVYTCTTAFIP